MNTIDLQIFEYLIRHKKLCLDNLGGFVFEEIPAHYNKDTQTFIPPTFKVYFSEKLKCNSVPFLFYLSEKEKVSFQRAKLLLDNIIVGLKDDLKTKKVTFINPLGELISKDGKIFYKPSEFIKNIERFGFEELPVYTEDKFIIAGKIKLQYPVKNKTIKRYIAAASLIISLLLMPNKPSVDYKASMADIITQNRYSYTDNLTKKEKKLLTGVEKTFSIKSSLYPVQPKSTEQSVTSAKEVAVKDTVKEFSEELNPANEKPQIRTQLTEKANSKVFKCKALNKGNYAIVIGAFSNERNAKRFMKANSSVGTLQIRFEKGLYRVYIPGFATKKEALDFRRKLSSNGLQGWITRI